MSINIHKIYSYPISDQENYPSKVSLPKTATKTASKIQSLLIFLPKLPSPSASVLLYSSTMTLSLRPWTTLEMLLTFPHLEPKWNRYLTTDLGSGSLSTYCGAEQKNWSYISAHGFEKSDQCLCSSLENLVFKLIQDLIQSMSKFGLIFVQQSGKSIGYHHVWIQAKKERRK